MNRDRQAELAENTPFFEHLGIEILQAHEGRARLKVSFRECLTHPFGYLHGGVIASLADSAGVNAVLSLLGDDEVAYTLEMKINFFRPTKDETIEAEGVVIHKGRRSAVADVAVTDRAGRMVAKALVTCALA